MNIYASGNYGGLLPKHHDLLFQETAKKKSLMTDSHAATFTSHRVAVRLKSTWCCLLQFNILFLDAVWDV